MVSALLVAICVGGAVLAPVISPYDPFDLASLNLMDSMLPPAMLDGGSGEDVRVGGVAAGQAAAEDYVAHRYHKPQDEYDPGWDWSGAVEDLRLYYALGRGLASGSTWPNWYRTAEFRAIRDRDRAGDRASQ